MSAPVAPRNTCKLASDGDVAITRDVLVLKENSVLGNVMVVDDTQVDQMMCARVINRSKMAGEIINFTNPEDAICYLETPGSEAVGLILLDLNMPRMNGFEFLQTSFERFGCKRDIPVVLMFGSAPLPKTRQRIAEFPWIKGEIVKPLRLDAFTAAIRSLGL